MPTRSPSDRDARTRAVAPGCTDHLQHNSAAHPEVMLEKSWLTLLSGASRSST
ncbi:hypothetical protein FM106_30625 [Brachybacterium faecium]|nr:hypothetical protein FM106_30625 [Brachybacterium faecium]